MDTEKLGRFGHHPDPAIDFCVEVESIEGEWLNVQIGFENGTPTKEELVCRVEKSMSFTVGGDLNAISAKTLLRKIDAEINPARQTKMVGALAKINDIRNSIIGCQTVNWSEHIYPLVAALEEAGFEGAGYPASRANVGTMLERTLAAENEVINLRAALGKIADMIEAEDADLDDAITIASAALVTTEGQP